MGLFDDALPGGSVTKPLLVALGVLLAGKMFSGRGKEEAEEPEAIPDRRSPQADTPVERNSGPTASAEKGDGGLLDGLGDLLDRVSKGGNRETADSWVKPGAENKSISPGDLGQAIGNTTLKEIARRTGMSEEQLLEQLSKVLPGVVDKLTPDGRVPSNKDVAQQFPNSPW